MTKEYMHQRTPTLVIQGLLLCALALAGTAGAASVDEDKFRLLSCVTDKVTPKALEWFNQVAQTQAEDGKALAGPLKLGKACLKNVSVNAGFGALVVQGEICNGSLDEFTGALAGVGISVGKFTDSKIPGVVLGRGDERSSYLVTDRLIDMKTGKTLPLSGKYAFTCFVNEGGAQ